MIFAQLHEALRLEIVRRIERGVLSGTLLARQTGLNQAHISNFLHCRRMLSLRALDKVLIAQRLSVAALMVPAEPRAPRAIKSSEGQYDVVPLVSHASAIRDVQVPSGEVILEMRLMNGTLQSYPELPSRSRREWQRFVAVRVTSIQARGMRPILSGHAVVILDRHYNTLPPGTLGVTYLFAVKFKDGLTFRYVSQLGNRLVLRPYKINYPLAEVVLLPGQTVSDLLVGRVCRMETDS